MLDVAAIEEVGATLGGAATGMSSGVNMDEVDGGQVNTPQIPLGGQVVPGSEAEIVAMKNKYDNRQRAIKEITVSQLLQKELAKSDPNLVSVFAFMNKVCGTGSEARKLKEAALSAIQKGTVIREEAVPMAALVNTVVTEGESIAATGTEKRDGVIDAADVEEYTKEPESVTKSRPTTIVDGVRDAIMKPSDASVALPDEAVQEHDATDVISLADTIMSVDGSSSDGDQSPSTSGSSVSATGTHKRLAEGSPERECGEGSRREFPGLITRRAARCRVYIPNTGSDKGDCPGRVLNDDGTFAVKVAIGQDCHARMDEEGEIATGACNVNEVCGPRDGMSGEKTKFVPPSPSLPALSSSIITSTTDPVIHSTIAPQS